MAGPFSMALVSVFLSAGFSLAMTMGGPSRQMVRAVRIDNLRMGTLLIGLGTWNARARGYGILLLIVRGVFLDEGFPLGGQVFLGEDGLDGAFVDAQAAVDAGIGVDIKQLGGF